MREILIKTLIPILLLSVAELFFFTNIGIKDVNKSMMGKLYAAMENAGGSILEYVPRKAIVAIENVNRRMYVCKKTERKLHNQKLISKGVTMCVLIAMVIVILLVGYTPDQSWIEWWVATIIESAILLAVVITFQLTFLNQIVKGGYQYSTNNELKYRIYNALKDMKTGTI